MNKLFRFTIILIVLFTIAVSYYFYIWISFEPEDPLGGDKEDLAYSTKRKDRIISNYYTLRIDTNIQNN